MTPAAVVVHRETLLGRRVDRQGPEAPSARRPKLPEELQERWKELAAAIEDEDTRSLFELAAAEVEPPPAEPGSLSEAIDGWGSVAQALVGDPRSASIAGAVVNFVADTAQLYERTARPEPAR